MFNNEIKERYIEEKNKSATLPNGYLRCQFDKVEKYERENGKDVCCFTVREIREYYKILNTSSLEFIASLNSQFSQYTQWCLQNNMVIDNQNHFLEIDLGVMRECLNAVTFNKKIVTRENILNWCEELQNPKDQVIMLGLFEGLKGKDFCDFVKLKPEDVNGNVLTLNNGREIKVSNKLISYIEESINETKYYSYSKNEKGHGKIVNLVDLGYVIKFYPNIKEDVSDYQKGRVVYNCISRCLKYIGVFNIVTANSIFESGKIHMIKERSKELNMTVRDYIYSNHIHEVEHQYDCKILRSSFILKYGDHLK